MERNGIAIKHFISIYFQNAHQKICYWYSAQVSLGKQLIGCFFCQYIPATMSVCSAHIDSGRMEMVVILCRPQCFYSCENVALILIISQRKPSFPSVLSFDRFLAIRSPMTYKKWITKKRASAVVAFILVATGLMGVLPVLTEQHQYSTSHQCLYATLFPRSFVLGVSSYFIVAIVITAPLYIQVSHSKFQDSHTCWTRSSYQGQGQVIAS